MSITAGNYAAQAERALLQHPAKAWAFDRGAQMIGDAIHFVLPDGGRLLNDELRGLMGTPLRLPYPNITVEWWDGWRPHKRLLHAFEDDEHVGIHLYVDGGYDDGWRPAAVVVMYEIGCPVSESTRVSAYWEAPGPSSFDTLEQVGEANKATRPLWEMLEVLNCTNIETRPLFQVDKKKNDRRIKAGKLPIYETRELVVRAHRGSQAVPLAALAGERETRMFSVRGHIKRRKTGNFFWSAHMRGNAALGRIEKSYVVAA